MTEVLGFVAQVVAWEQVGTIRVVLERTGVWIMYWASDLMKGPQLTEMTAGVVIQSGEQESRMLEVWN